MKAARDLVCRVVGRAVGEEGATAEHVLVELARELQVDELELKCWLEVLSWNANVERVAALAADRERRLAGVRSRRRGVERADGAVLRRGAAPRA